MPQDQKSSLKTYSDIPLSPATEGVVLESVLSHYVAPEGSFSFIENLHNDTIGQTTSRRPLVFRVTPSASVTGVVLYQYLGGSPYVMWKEGTTINTRPIDGTGSTTPFVGVIDANMTLRGDTIMGYFVYPNYTAGQPRYFDGTAATAFGSTSFPIANPSLDLLSAGFDGRIWCASTTDVQNRVYYTDTLTGTISATTGGANFLRINANNADRITGFVRTQNVLYVFTHNGVFRIYNTQSQDNSPIAPVGAFSPEGIVTAKDGYYFYHPSGIYRLTENGKPVEISQRVRELIQKVPSTYQASVKGWSDEDHVYFSLGSSLSGYDSGKTWVIRYTISSQVWTTYSYYDQDIKYIAYGNPATTSGLGSGEDYYPVNWFFVEQLSNSANRYAGTANMYVPSTENSNVSHDFNTFPIFIRQVSHWNVFGAEAHIKRINGLAFPHDNGGGLKLSYITDKDTGNSFRPIGELNDNYVTLFQDFQSDAFNRIKIQLAGSVTASVRIGRPIILGLDDLGYRNN